VEDSVLPVEQSPPERETGETQDDSGEDVSNVYFGAGELIALVRQAYMGDRPRVIRDLLPKISPRISGHELAHILSLIYMSDRPEVIRLFADKLRHPVNPKDLVAIISSVYMSDRRGVARALISFQSKGPMNPN
jgi:hypothetical protein